MIYPCGLFFLRTSPLCLAWRKWPLLKKYFLRNLRLYEGLCNRFVCWLVEIVCFWLKFVFPAFVWEGTAGRDWLDVCRCLDSPVFIEWCDKCWWWLFLGRSVWGDVWNVGFKSLVALPLQFESENKNKMTYIFLMEHLNKWPDFYRLSVVIFARVTLQW